MKKLTLNFALVAVIAGVLAIGMLAGAPAEATTLDHPLALGAFALGGLVINRQNLAVAFTGFQTVFNQGVAMAQPEHERLVMRVTSSTAEEKYGWLKAIPGMREWLGDRIHHNLALGDYAIKNKDFELTVDVDRNHFDDDTYGVLSPAFQMLGYNAAIHPTELVFDLLPAGFTDKCWDGKAFFATDHPLLDKNGKATTFSNSMGGAGTAWYLMDVSMPIRPIVLQVRKAPMFVSKDDPRDDNLFEKKKFVYGVDDRKNVGFGLPQLAIASKQTLNAANFETSLKAMQEMKTDYGRRLNLGRKPLLVVPPSLRSAAAGVVNMQLINGGESNPNYQAAELMVTGWLA